MGNVFAPRSWPQLSLDVVILAYTFTFTLVSLNYCAAMWQLRREFSIALRCVHVQRSSIQLKIRGPRGKCRLTAR